MQTNFTIRTARQSDSVELRDLYKNTVLIINRRDYSQEEVEDWASCGNDLSKIEKMIETHYFIVAVDQQLQIVGFSGQCKNLRGKFINCYLCLQIHSLWS